MLKKHLFFIMIFFLYLNLQGQTSSELSKLGKLDQNSEPSELINYTKKLLYKYNFNENLAYYLASTYAENKEKDSALKYLKKTVGMGFNDYRKIETDEAFSDLKESPEFNAIVKKAKKDFLSELSRKSIQLEEGETHTLYLRCDFKLPRVRVKLSYDPEYLYIKGKIIDEHFYDGNRSWRYGDGFFITFVTDPEASTGYTDKYYSFGFSQVDGAPTAVLVNKNGDYFLKKKQNLIPEIEIDLEWRTAYYDIKIPWKELYPFQPLMDEKAGINITYISKRNDDTRKFLHYVDDPNYDTERTDLRRYADIHFLPSDKENFRVEARLENRLVAGNELKLNLAGINPRDDEHNLSIKVFNKAAEEILTKAIDPDLGDFKKEYDLSFSAQMEPGLHEVQLLEDGKIIWQDKFYKFDFMLFSEINRIIGSNEGSGDQMIKNSLDALRYHFFELREEIGAFSKFDDIGQIKSGFDGLIELKEKIKVDKTIYNKEGYLLSAFKSQNDGSLQPFSIVLPKDFDPAKEYDLLIALHGSGVDEVNFVKNMSKRFDVRWSPIIIAPRGRHLSSWWTGKSESDIYELCNLADNLFNIRKCIAGGFSMGGYGVWRVTLKKPDMFDAGLVISGIPRNKWTESDEDNALNFLPEKCKTKYLVVHGTDDHSLDINETDRFVERLKSKGFSIDYHRIDGAGHGNYNFAKILENWIKENL
jgi:predicted esterase